MEDVEMGDICFRLALVDEDVSWGRLGRLGDS